MKTRHQIRITLYGLAILLTFGLLTARLYQLQILQTDRFRMLANKNRFRLVPLEAARGIIYDRQGRVLVRNVPRFAVTIVPAYLPEDPDEESEQGQ